MEKRCELCDGHGHLLTEQGWWVRCKCIEKQLLERQLGVFYTAKPAQSTPLNNLVEENAVLEGSLDSLRPHVARVLMDLQGKKIQVTDAYRLVEIFLEKDDEIDYVARLNDCDLLIMLVGFGDPKNRYLPELMIQVFGRREVLRLPTWVILGVDMASVGMKYSAEVAAKMSGFRRVKIR